MHNTQGSVAGIDAVHNDSKGIHIHDLCKRGAFGFHFFINTIQMFFSAPNDGWWQFGLVGCLSQGGFNGV